MHVPSITAFYLGILALIYAALALRVAGMRRSNRVLFGDAENTGLRAAIRVHANFIEYVPIITLLVALLEMSGMPAMRVHLLMGGLLLSRLLHPLGMAARPGTWQFTVGRVAGILLTIAVLVAAAIGAIRRFWPF
jgi:uncharacterized membrane protein YecN with MAPEG domain